MTQSDVAEFGAYVRKATGRSWPFAHLAAALGAAGAERQDFTMPPWDDALQEQYTRKDDEDDPELRRQMELDAGLPTPTMYELAKEKAVGQKPYYEVVVRFIGGRESRFQIRSGGAYGLEQARQEKQNWLDRDAKLTELGRPTEISSIKILEYVYTTTPTGRDTYRVVEVKGLAEDDREKEYDARLGDNERDQNLPELWGGSGEEDRVSLGEADGNQMEAIVGTVQAKDEGQDFDGDIGVEDEKGLIFDSVQTAGRWLSDRWAQLENRYGRKQALAMAVAMIGTLPLPGNVAAIVAVAEGIRGLQGYFNKEFGQ